MSIGKVTFFTKPTKYIFQNQHSVRRDAYGV